MSQVLTTPDSPAAIARQDSGGRILLINDSDVQLIQIQSLLSRSGYEVKTANSAMAALEMLREWVPDLIISDVVMPGIDGVALCRAIKANAMTASVPVLLVTALRYDDAGIIEGLEAGADDYLELDAPPVLLIRKAGRLIDQARHQRARVAAEKALRDSEMRLRLLIENAYEIIAIVSDGGIIRYENSCVERTLGYKPEELRGKSVIDMVHPSDLPIAAEALALLSETGGNVTPPELRVLHKDGSWRWMEITASNFVHEPAIGGIVVNAHDITGRKTALEELRQAIDLKEAIFQGSRDAIFISDSQSRFVVVNSSACELTGYTENELLRMAIPDLHEENEREAFRRYHARIMAGEEIVSEARITRKDGTKIDVEFNNRRVAIGNAPYMHTVARDSTERMQAQEAVRSSEERYRAVVSQSANCIFLIDLDSRRILESNPAIQNLLGYSQEEMLQLRIHDIIADDAASVDLNIGSIIAEGSHSVGERLYRRKNGTAVPLDMNANLISYGGRQVICAVGYDVSVRKEMEEALRASERQYRLLFERNVAAVVCTTIDGQVLDCNDAFVRLIGHDRREDVLNCNAADFHFTTEAREAYLARVWGEQSITSMEVKLRGKQGQAVDAIVNLTLLDGDEGKPPILYGTLIDISVRKEAEEALKESEERYRELFENANDLIYTLDLDGNFTSANKAVERLFGYSREELVMMNRSEPSVRDLAESGMEALRKALMGRSDSMFEAEVLCKDGRRVTIEANVRIIHREGVPAGIQGVARDITERRLAEERFRDFAEKLEDSNAELARFAYIASHDLQEPLRKVQAFADRLQAKYGHLLTGEGQDYLGRMLGAAKRMQTLITDLLQLSRVTTKGAAFVHTDLGQVLRDVVSDLEIQIEQSGATVNLSYLPTIEADPTQIRQLFQNLIGNALKFHQPEIPPVISIKYQMIENREQQPNVTGQICRISIEDNGIGFDQKYADRIFSPFQRLHGRGVYEGTGIGLAVCKRIIERHGGSISAESETGKGSCFAVALPVRQNGIHRA